MAIASMALMQIHAGLSGWWHWYNFSPDELSAMNVEGNYPFWPSVSPIVISSYFLGLAFILFAIAVFFFKFCHGQQVMAS
jgi:hypothetical protein